MSQNRHAAREEENADALEDDNDHEGEQEWRYPGQYYERADSKVTFAEVFGEQEEDEDDRKMPANDDNDGDDSSLEEFQSAVQELPVEPTPTSQVARLPFVQEEQEEE